MENWCYREIIYTYSDDVPDSAGMLSSVSLYKEERCDVPIFTRSIYAIKSGLSYTC